MKYLLAISLFFVGCVDTKMERIKKRKTAEPKFVTCTMNNFKGFPSRVKGQVAFVFKNSITIAVLSRDKASRVDLTFPRNRCK